MSYRATSQKLPEFKFSPVWKSVVNESTISQYTISSKKINFYLISIFLLWANGVTHTQYIILTNKDQKFNYLSSGEAFKTARTLGSPFPSWARFPHQDHALWVALGKVCPFSAHHTLHAALHCAWPPSHCATPWLGCSAGPWPPDTGVNIIYLDDILLYLIIQANLINLF